ncbi:MAG TPA: condensation domain-containing protein, partial [Thermoanaerobaculia bacterium]
IKCFYRVPDPPAPHVQPVGVPMPETQALVLADGGDEGSVLCGLGEVGEIVLRTPFRSLGYLNNPGETRARFRPNPFRPLQENREDLLYFTGDRGRYRLDGSLEILGRLDAQVKVRGVRIEPAEIRSCLGRHEAVSESAVVLREARPGDSGDHRLVAYVVSRPGAVWDPEDLRRHLRLELPEVMIPAAFVALDALPLTPNGKLDARALPAPVLASGEHRALHTPVEEITAGLWAELLGLAYVGPDDNFFALGGHSLIGAQLISRLRQTFSIDLPLRVLFETRTLAGLAAEVERLRGAPNQPTISSFRQDRATPPPLSFAQERYWTGRHLEARSVASTIPMLMHLAGPLDGVCLRQALAAVVDRHELLRTSFQEGPAGPVQVIHPAVSVALPEVDLERLGAAERTAEVRRFAILDGRLHFEYERAPLFRATLFRCAAEEHILLFTIHHVASDWWSGTLLVREVSALYFAFHTGQPSSLPPLAAQFQDFARWQRRLSAEETQASQVTFWREHLSGAVPIDLGAGRPRPRQWTFAAGTEEILVPEELERQLDLFSAREGVTLF